MATELPLVPSLSLLPAPSRPSRQRRLAAPGMGCGGCLRSRRDRADWSRFPSPCPGTTRSYRLLQPFWSSEGKKGWKKRPPWAPVAELTCCTLLPSETSGRMERSRAAGGSSNGQPREESGDGDVQIPASGKLIRSPGSCHPELGRSCAGKCQLHPIPAQSYYHLPNALTLRSSPRRQPPARCSPADPPSHPPAGLAGTGRGHPRPLQGVKASGSEGAGRTARCPRAEPEPEQPRLGAWHWYSRL